MDECGDKVPKPKKLPKSCKDTGKHKHETCVYLRDEPNDPEKKLTTWEKTVKGRKILNNKITTVTQREPVNAVMHSEDKYRLIRERKTIMDRAQIKEKPAIRGGLWEFAPRLYQECPCEDPVYEIKRTRDELGNPQQLEYVEVPEYIRKEEEGIKGEHVGDNSKHGTYLKSEYKELRTKELESEIRRLQPHRPFIRDIVVIGGKPKVVKKKPLLPKIVINQPKFPCITEIYEIYALRINNSVFVKDHPSTSLDYLRSLQKEKWHENKTSWNYYFNVLIDKVSRTKITLVNLGTVRLHYCWDKVKPDCRTYSIPIDPLFFFNKNEDVLSPGQSRDIHVIFISNMAGVFQEVWQLTVQDVEFLESGQKFTFYLNADAVESNLQELKIKTMELRTFILTEDRDYTIKLMLDEILHRALKEQPASYAYEKMFLDSDIFLMKNPDCYYHQTEVEKLREMYNQMVGDKGPPWDLSLDTLTKQIIQLEFVMRMDCYQRLKASYQILLIPWEEKVCLEKIKYSAMRSLLEEFVDAFETEDCRLSLVYRRNTNNNIGKVGFTEQVNAEIRSQLLYMAMREKLSKIFERGFALLSSIDLNKPVEFRTNYVRKTFNKVTEYEVSLHDDEIKLFADSIFFPENN